MAVRHQSLSEQVYRSLRTDILRGKLPAGYRLGVKELQQQFDVSSTAVREALMRLAQERLVNYIPNAGATVIELSGADIRHLLEMCLLYDRYAAEAAAASEIHEELASKLEVAVNEQKSFIRKENPDIRDYESILGGFHYALYQMTGNPWLIRQADECNSLLYLADVRRNQDRQEYPEESVAEHVKIIDAIREGDVFKAAEAAAFHRQQERKRFGL